APPARGGARAGPRGVRGARRDQDAARPRLGAGGGGDGAASEAGALGGERRGEGVHHQAGLRAAVMTKGPLADPVVGGPAPRPSKAPFAVRLVDVVREIP